MDCVGFFFCAGFLADFFAVFPVFCAANAAFELITAVVGSSTAAPNAPSMTATIRCFIGTLHCEPSWTLDAQIAQLTNQSGEFLTDGRIFVVNGPPHPMAGYLKEGVRRETTGRVSMMLNQPGSVREDSLTSGLLGRPPRGRFRQTARLF
jgi:hypothetical protein